MELGLVAGEFWREMLLFNEAALLREFPLFRTYRAGDISSPAFSTDDAASLDEAAYVAAVDQVVRSTVHSGASSFADISQHCEGAWPGLTKERLSHLGLMKSIQSERVREPAMILTPELHCGFGEWYFSLDSARDLAKELISKRSFSLLFGCPTVARFALDARAEFALVDSNPFVNLRFPQLRGNLHYSSVEQLNTAFPQPTTIFFDAPWYMPRILFWLAKASQFANGSTTIAMPLFQRLTRPAALVERANILEIAERIGRVELVQNCITYDTPLYEAEALASKGVVAHQNWRRADLLIIRNASPIKLPQIDHSEFQEIWENFMIGSQIVRLRLHPIPRKREAMIAPIPGTERFVYDTVSARDVRRRKIDIWTSRNRVAIVGDVRRARYVLSLLENSRQSTDKSLRSLLSSTDAGAFCELLDCATLH